MKKNLYKEYEEKDKIKKMGLYKKTLKQLSKLKTEEDLVKDVTKDFEKSGWRLV